MANKKPTYSCPYDCHNRLYPKPKWKKESTLIKHLKTCPKNPYKNPDQLRIE